MGIGLPEFPRPMITSLNFAPDCWPQTADLSAMRAWIAAPLRQRHRLLRVLGDQANCTQQPRRQRLNVLHVFERKALAVAEVEQPVVRQRPNRAILVDGEGWQPQFEMCFRPDAETGSRLTYTADARPSRRAVHSRRLQPLRARALRTMRECRFTPDYALARWRVDCRARTKIEPGVRIVLKRASWKSRPSSTSSRWPGKKCVSLHCQSDACR